jgi:hypothetical protein
VLRTVTFSDPQVADFINKNFVAAWFNRGPGFFNDDLSTEKWIFSGSMEAYPTKNICTFFLAPDGKVFDYRAGSWSPDLFLKSLKTALELRRALYDDAMKAKDGGVDAARKIHGTCAMAMALERERVVKAQSKEGGWKKILPDGGTFVYRGATHQHSAACLSSLSSGYDYLARVHQMWSETAALPDLDEIRYAYLWGNTFTEESAQSKSIEGGDASKQADPLASGKPRPLMAPEDTPVSAIRVTPRGVKLNTGLPSLLELSGSR